MQPVDIVIKSWNAVAHTLRTIQSIRDSTTLPHRIIVADDGSTADNLALIEALGDVELVRHNTNRGSAATARTGFAQTRSELFVLMDSDVVVSPRWLENLMHHTVDPRVAIVSPLRFGSLLFPGSTQHCRDRWNFIKRQYEDPAEAVERYLDGYSLSEFASALSTSNGLTDHFVDAPPGFVSSSCILIRRPWVEAAGGIADVDLESYGEDVDLCWRIGLAGGRIVRTASVYVHHYEHSSVEINGLHPGRMMAKSNRVLYKKWAPLVLDAARPFPPDTVEARFPFVRMFRRMQLGREEDTF